jgi:hypothetical protein
MMDWGVDFSRRTIGTMWASSDTRRFGLKTLTKIHQAAK